MAKHARHKPIPKKWIIGSAVSAGAVLLIVFVVLLVQNGLLPVFAYPLELRGAFLTAGTDYWT